jgi:hypothetical protein
MLPFPRVSAIFLGKIERPEKIHIVLIECPEECETLILMAKCELAEFKILAWNTTIQDIAIDVRCRSPEKGMH